MKVLIVDWSPIVSGAQFVTLNLSSELARRFDYEFAWALPPGRYLEEVRARGLRATETSSWHVHRPKDLIDGVIVTRRTLALARELRVATDRYRVNMVLAISTRSGLVALLSQTLGRVPIVVYVLDIRHRGLQQSVLSRFARRIFVVSEGVGEQFRTKKVELLRLALPESQTDYGRRPVSDAFVFGIVGQVIPWKGQELFLRAAALVSAARPETRFVVVGGDDLVPGELERLRRLAHELQLDGVVEFTGPLGSPAEIYGRLDALVHCSVLPDPYPLVVLEAMAAGKPVIAARAGGVPEVVQDEVSGLLYPPGDVNALSQSMQRVMQDSALRGRLRTEGARVADLHRMSAMAERADRILRSSLA